MKKPSKREAIAELSRLKRQALELARKSLSEKKKIAFRKWHSSTGSALRNYFGEDSIDYQTFLETDFKLAPVQPTRPGQSSSTKDHRTAMRSIAAILDSKVKEIQLHWPDAPEEPKIKISDFWQIIHPKIKEVSQQLFKDEHFTGAVRSALIEIEEQVKRVTGLTDQNLTGTKLMQKVFSPKQPIIEISKYHDGSAQAVQQGYMQLFAGAMMGVRNPLAHANFELHQEEAVHLIFLASHLMTVLDRSIKKENNRSADQ